MQTQSTVGFRYRVTFRGHVNGQPFELVEFTNAPTHRQALESALSRLPDGVDPRLEVLVVRSAR